MIIYRVEPGDTLVEIGRRYNVPVSSLAEINEMIDPDRLVVGQAILIPTDASEDDEVPTPQTRYSQGYFFPATRNRADTALDIIDPIITFIAIFEFTVDWDLNLIIPQNIMPVVQSARERNISPLITLTNLLNGEFNPNLARRVMQTQESRSQYISRVINLVNEFNLDGVNLDFENMYPQDRQLYTTFTSEMKDALGDRILSMAMPPKWEDLPERPWVGTFDYAALGEIVDFAFMMTYEWAWRTGPPGPISPPQNVRRVLEYALGLIPGNKIMQGLNLYGYRWLLPQTPEIPATTMSLGGAINLAWQQGVPIQFDEQSQTPWYRYVNEQGSEYEVWFEDVESILAKLRVNIDLEVGGIGYWSPWNIPYGSRPVRYVINNFFDFLEPEDVFPTIPSVGAL